MFAPTSYVSGGASCHAASASPKDVVVFVIIAVVIVAPAAPRSAEARRQPPTAAAPPTADEETEAAFAAALAAISDADESDDFYGIVEDDGERHDTIMVNLLKRLKSDPTPLPKQASMQQQPAAPLDQLRQSLPEE